MAQQVYKPAGTSALSETGFRIRKEVLVPKTLTDYTLLYHYGDLDSTPVRGVSFLATLSDGEVRQGTLDDTGRAQLARVSPGPVKVVYQHDAPIQDSPEIVAARSAVQSALQSVVAQTRLDMAEEWKEWNEAGWLKQRYLEVANRGQGAAVGAWEWLSGTVETFWQLAVLLYKTDKEIRDLRTMILTGQWDALDQKIAGYRAKGEQVLGAGSTVKELLILLFHDQPTRQLIYSFSANWWEAIPPDEREELKVSQGSQIAIDVVIGVIIAAFTAGTAAVVYGSAKWSQRIGKLGTKLAALLDKLKDAFVKLAEALKLRKRRVVDVKRPNGAKVVETKWEADPQPITLTPGTDYALVNGVKVFPRVYDKLYHGTTTSQLGLGNMNNQQAAAHIYQHGLPARGKNIDLGAHSEGVEDRAFRGTTAMIQTPDGQAGAILWADEGGLLIQLKDVKAYDVNELLDGRVKNPDGTFGGAKFSGEQEFAVPGEISPDNIHTVYDVIKDQRGKLRREEIKR